MGNRKIKCIDLFCGIGGFRIAAEILRWKTVFSSDIDEECQKAYEANFGEKPVGNIKEVEGEDIPDHDILLAGFPCQSFSIIGSMKGFEDTRGTLFFDIARILQAKHPEAFVLENVKMLAGHNGGQTIRRIMQVLKGLGYEADYRILNALDFGLPQKRERIFIVGMKGQLDFSFPEGGVPMRPLSSILEKKVPKSFYASDHIRNNRRKLHLKPHPSPAIWHENKAGHISSYPFSCALRAGASYNYLLVDGIRRLTPRELHRLQGFSDTFQIVCNDSQARKQAGNSVPVPVVSAILQRLDVALKRRMKKGLTESAKLLPVGSAISPGAQDGWSEITNSGEGKTAVPAR